MCLCNSVLVIESVCICARLSLRLCMHTRKLLCVCEHFTVILLVCTWIKTTCVIFAQRVWSMQHSWAANEETALVTGQLCVYFFPRSFVRPMSRVKPHRLWDQHESLRHTRVLRLWWTSALTGFVGQPVLSYGCRPSQNTCTRVHSFYTQSRGHTENSIHKSPGCWLEMVKENRYRFFFLTIFFVSIVNNLNHGKSSGK